MDLETQSVSFSYATNGVAVGTPFSATASGNTSENASVVVGGSTANQALSFSLNYASLQGALMWSSGGNLTVKTNDATTPDDTFSLVANVPLVWMACMPISNPFSANITGLYLTNADSGNVTFSIRTVRS